MIFCVFLLSFYQLFSSVGASVLNNYFGAASSEVRQAYKGFLGSVVEVIDGEVSSEEFREVAKKVYDLFGGSGEENDNNRRFADKK